MTKKGNVSMIITLTVSFLILIVLIVYVINMITPFIWQQKLQNIANRYIYIVERFGYLTNVEEKNLYEELEQEGFQVKNIKIVCPKERLEYGTLFKFEICYEMEQNYSIFSEGIKSETRVIPLRIKKYSYSKI